jgi:hypothetical protein
LAAKSENRGETVTEKINAISPLGFPPKVNLKKMAPRLEGLEGKTVYLVDPRFDDSGLFMTQLQRVFAQRLPGVKTRIVQMNNVYHHDDPKTWQEIQANGDAAIIGVGH